MLKENHRTSMPIFNVLAHSVQLLLMKPTHPTPQFGGRIELRQPITLRAKTLLLIIVTLIGLLITLSIPVYTVGLESFNAIEKQYVQEHLERATNAFFDELADIDRTTSDYASWDDTYIFAIAP